MDRRPITWSEILFIVLRHEEGRHAIVDRRYVEWLLEVKHWSGLATRQGFDDAAVSHASFSAA